VDLVQLEIQFGNIHAWFAQETELALLRMSLP
jgi:hypothetical protein